MEEPQPAPTNGTSAGRKALIGALAAFTLTGGSIAVAAIAPGGIAGAQDDTPAEELPAEPEQTDESGDADEGDEADRERRGSGRFAGVITSLVDDGTITQDQADVIAERFAEARANQGERAGGRGARGHGHRFNLDTVTEVTGLTEDEVRDGLRSGQSLAEIAGDAADELEAALIADANERIDAALESGRLSEQQAAARRENTAERVQSRLAGEGRNRGTAQAD